MDRFYVAMQALVTCALLLFSFAIRETDPSVSTVVVGATVLHWLRETSYMGRARAEQVKAEQDG